MISCETYLQKECQDSCVEGSSGPNHLGERYVKIPVSTIIIELLKWCPLAMHPCMSMQASCNLLERCVAKHDGATEDNS